MKWLTDQISERDWLAIVRTVTTSKEAPASVTYAMARELWAMWWARWEFVRTSCKIEKETVR